MKNFLGKFKRNKTDRPKTRKNGKPKKSLFEIFLICLISGMILVFAAGVSFAAYVVVNSPTFDPNALFSSEASVILDVNGNEFARIGGQMRENVTFDDLPEVFLDAIIAAEDARFFQHGGVDWGRFMVATMGQLRGNRAAGGASTITMQVITNTQTERVVDGFAGIVRKFTDVYMSIFQLERQFTKEQIIEFYVNLPFLGCGAWGVEQAAQIYFGKSISEVTLVEAATIAGLFNAPDTLDPCRHPERAEGRRNQILNLMVRHNKLTEEEYLIARSIPMESMLVDHGELRGHEMQDAIDTVVQEVIDRTGFNPHQVSMRIYSTINLDQQRVINDIYNGTLHQWPNDTLQTGIAVIDVQSGAISAVGAGRNRRGDLSFNYATMIRRHPGSTAKTMFSYAPGIEFLGWSTGQMILDEPHRFTNGPQVRNWDNRFMGAMTIREALALSRNVPAVYAFQQINNRDIDTLVTNIGMRPEYGPNHYINEAHSLGGYNGSNPVEMAAAHAAFARGGVFIEPHSFTRVVFTASGEEFEVTPEIRQAMSEETAFMVNMMLRRAVTSGFHPAANVSGTDVVGKTGTSTLDPQIIRRYRLPSSAINDSWIVTYSPDVVFAIWIGYDRVNAENFLTGTIANRTRNNLSRILSGRLFPTNSRFQQPNSVVTATIELETNPIRLASEFTPDNLRSTEWFRRGTVPVESTRFSRLEAPTNLQVVDTPTSATLTWNPIATPEFIDQAFLNEYFRIGFTNWATQYLQRRLTWNENNKGALGYEIFLNGTSVGWTANSSFTFNGPIPPNSVFSVRSAYQRFRANSSNPVTFTVTGAPTWSLSPTFNICQTHSEFASNHSAFLSGVATFANIVENGSSTPASGGTLSCLLGDTNVACDTLSFTNNYTVRFSVNHLGETRSVNYNIQSSC